MAESTTYDRNGISWCELCNVRVPSAASRVEHLNGRLHKSKVNALKGSTDKSPANALKRSLEISPHNAKSVGEESSRKQTKLQDAPVVKKAELEAVDSNVKCEVCDKVFSSSLIALQHFKGKEHASKVMSTLKLKTEAKTPNGVLKCEDCDKEFSTELLALQHFKGKKHAARIESISKEKMKPDQVDPAVKCDICDKVFTSTLSAVQHFQGKKHAANLRSSLQSQSQKSNVGSAKHAANLQSSFQSQSQKSNVGSAKHAANLPSSLQSQSQKSNIGSAKVLANKSSANTLNKSVEIIPPNAKAVAKEISNNESKKESLVSENKAKVEVSDPDLRCEVCDKVFSNGKSALSHFKGKKHAEMSKRAEKPKQEVNCDVCDIKFSNEENAILHFKGKKHIAKVTAKARQQQQSQVKKKQYNTKQESWRSGRAGSGQSRGSSTGGSTNRFQPFKGSENKSYGKRYSPYDFSNTQDNSGSNVSNSISNGWYKNFDNGSSGSMYMSGTDPTLAHISSVSNDIMHLKRMLREYEY